MGQNIGIFGLGLVGMALAERLMANGYSVAGYDPDQTRRALLKQSGGHAAEAAQVWTSDLIFSAVFETDQLAALIAEAPVGAGGCLLSFSTCDPDRMAALGAKARAKSWHLIESPVSGTSKQLAEGQAVFLLAGDSGQIETLLPLFQILGRACFNVGAIGNGNRAKLAINLVLGLNRAALAEGLVFAEKLELDPDLFLDLLKNSAAQSQVMEIKGALMVSKTFAAQGRISQSMKDFKLIRDLARDRGQGLPFADTYVDMLQDCLAHAEGDLDNSAIILAIARSQEAEKPAAPAAK